MLHTEITPTELANDRIRLPVRTALTTPRSRRSPAPNECLATIAITRSPFTTSPLVVHCRSVRRVSSGLMVLWAGLALVMLLALSELARRSVPGRARLSATCSSLTGVPGAVTSAMICAWTIQSRQAPTPTSPGSRPRPAL